MLGAHVSQPPPRLVDLAPDVELPPGLEDVIQRGLVKIVRRAHPVGDRLPRLARCHRCGDARRQRAVTVILPVRAAVETPAARCRASMRAGLRRARRPAHAHAAVPGMMSRRRCRRTSVSRTADAHADADADADAALRQRRRAERAERNRADRVALVAAASRHACRLAGRGLLRDDSAALVRGRRDRARRLDPDRESSRRSRATASPRPASPTSRRSSIQRPPTPSRKPEVKQPVQTSGSTRGAKATRP